MKEIEKQILKETQGLTSNTLNEILDFILFIKNKRLKVIKKKVAKDNLNLELSNMNQKELLHLEKEFKDYKEIYPHDE